MATDIMRVGARGGGVTILGQLVKVLLQLVGVIVLARLLDPAEFGLVAMVMVFVGLGELLRDFGLPTAALQASTLTQRQASNLFWLNSLLGLVLAGVLTLVTPLIVLLYGEQDLTAIVPIMAGILVLNGVQAQAQVQLARDLKFMTLTVTDIAAQVLALTTAIALAVAGAGVWALVAQSLVNAAALLLLRAVLGRWRPGLPRRRSGTRPLVSDAVHLGLSQGLTYLASNTDTAVVGARFDASALGFYNRAFQLLTVPLSRTLAPLTRIAVPSMRRAREEQHDPHRLMLRVQTTMGIALVGLFAIAATAAPIGLPVLLGERWAPTVPIFQLLAIGGCFQVFSYVSYWSFLLAQQPKQLLRYNLVTKPLTVLLVIAGSAFGVEGVAGAYALSLLVAWPINLVWLRRLTNQPMGAFASNGLRILLAGVVAAAAGLAVTWLLPAPDLARLALTLVATAGTYVGTLAVTPSGRRDLTGLVRLARTLIRRSGP